MTTTGRVLMDEIIMTDYGQFDLVWDDDGGFDGVWDRFFDGQINGLVGAADPNGVYLNLARRSGGSHVQLVIHDGEPPLPEATWEDVVEVSTTIPNDPRVRRVTWAAESWGPGPGINGGSYRVRVSARGRDFAATHEFADEVLDDYLIEMWQQPRAQDVILRVGSESAEFWHREIGGRR